MFRICLILIGSKAMPNFRQSLTHVMGDLWEIPEGQEPNALIFMMKDAFIDDFLDYGAEDGVYNYIF